MISAYFPNGQSVGSEKFAYKLAWLEALTHWLGEELRRHLPWRCLAITTSHPMSVTPTRTGRKKSMCRNRSVMPFAG